MQTKAKRSASRLLAILLVLTLCLGLLPAVALAEDVASELFFSQYIEGKSNNKALEIFNGTGKDVDLSAYSVELHANGNVNANNTVNLSGTLSNGAVLVLYHASSSDTLKSAAGSNAQPATVCNYNGEEIDYIILLKNGQEIDVIGSKTEQSINHKDYNLVRNSNVTGPSAVYDEIQWSGTQITGDTSNDYAGLGSHTMDGSGTPATVAAPQANPQAGQVTDGTQITLTCATSGASIYYTLDGTEPTSSSTLYSDSSKPTITGNVGTEVTLKAIAVRDEVSSVVQTLKYTIKAESEAPIADGDTVVIYNPAYNKALSSERASAGNFYNKGVNVTLIDSTLSGYGDTEIWTVTDNKDGTWSFSNGGKNIGMDDQYTSMPQGGKNDKWVLEDAGDGCWYIKNTVRDAYIEWYERNNNWSAYYPIDSGSEDLFKLKFYKTEGSSEPDPGTTATLVKTPSEGDIVLIYYPADGKAMSTEAYNYNNKKEELVAIDATVTDNTMTVPAGAAQFKVYKQDGHYVFKSDAGFLYLDGTNVRLAESMDEYTLFDLEETDNGWFVKSVNASFNGKAQYLEFYGGYFTCYGMNSGNTGIYTFQFFKSGTFDPKDDPLNTGAAPIKADDTVVIYAPDTMLSLSATVKSSYYPIGVKVEVSGDSISGYGNTEVWTVGGDAKNGFTFATAEGKLLSMAGSYASTYPGAGENDTWLLEPADTEGQYYVKNVGRNQYLLWDDKYDDWTTNSSSKTAVVFHKVDGLPENPDEPSGLEVRAKPVSGSTVEAGDVIELIAAEGTEIYYTLDGTDPTTNSSKYDGPLPVGSGSGQVPVPSTNKPSVIKAMAYIPATAESEAQTGQVYSFTYKAPMSLDGYELYFGQLHSHTNLSDGAGSIDEAFKHASGVDNLDFLAVTDHSNSFDNESNSGVGLGVDCSSISSEWKLGHDTAEEYTTDDFVGLYGFEMTWSDGFGHMNTYNTPGFESRNNSEFGNKSNGTQGYQNYYKELVAVQESLSQFNHPGTTFGDFQDFAFYSPSIDQRITLIEVGNGEGGIGQTGYFPSYEYYTRALDKGWHVAPTNNQDNHKGNWGDSNTARSVVLASDLSEEAIYDAIANYRVYATEDNDLSILYELNGNAMGSILPAQDGGVVINAEISDPTDSGNAKVEVIVNGGLVAASKTLANCNGSVTFEFDTNDYSYYYLRVTQADKNIAVTAPVWTGESLNAGISSVSCDTKLVVKDEKVKLSAEVYNNSGSDMTVNSLVFSVDGQPVYTASASDIGNNGIIPTGQTSVVTFAHSFAAVGKTSVDVALSATIDGASYDFSGVLQLTVTDPSLVTRILVDGTHWNDYVTGYYSDRMGNFVALAAENNAQVTIKQPGETITADDLKDVSLLVVSAPLKYVGNNVPEGAQQSTFSTDFINMVADYAKGGGTVILCGLADYQDNSSGAPYCSTEQINPILEAMGSTLRLNDDEVLDDDTNYNGGAEQTYRVYMDDFNTEAFPELFEGIAEGQRYSAYSGCSVDLGENGQAIVSGSANCYSINSKVRPDDAKGKWDSGKPKGETTSGSYNVDTAVATKGNVVTLATEQVGAGRVYVAGTVFLSNFEISDSSSVDYGDASYANKVIISNILSSVLKPVTVSSIAAARAGGENEVFTVEGIITAGNIEPNAFYDTIYIQDATGGIDIYPVSSTDGVFRVGQKVRVTGSRTDYQGDIELKTISIELIDSTVKPYEPKEFTLAEALDYDKNGGLLAEVRGTVKSVELVSGVISKLTLTDGTNDFRLLFNNYIGYSDESSTKLETFVKEGVEITAAGILYMDPEGACLRVRDRSEVKLSGSQENPDNPDYPFYPGIPVQPSEPDETEFPFRDVSESAWYYDAVVYVYENGLMDGVETDLFAPNATLTRAMVWTILARMEGVNTDGGATWYAKAQEWATASGVSDGENPMGAITREQFATMLWRYMDCPDGVADLGVFSDAGKISAYAKPALEWAVEAGIMNGVTEDMLDPQGNTTRAQAAAMFMRFAGVMVR